MRKARVEKAKIIQKQNQSNDMMTDLSYIGEDAQLDQRQ